MERVEAGFSFFIQTYNQQESKPFLVITGQNSSQYILPNTRANADKVARAIRIRGRLSEEMKQQIMVEGNATNTKEQTDNTYALLEQGLIRDPLIAFVSTWHFPRWYSTFVRTILAAEGEELKTQLFSSPVFKPWDQRSKDIPQIRRDRIVTEVDRIHKYRKKSDVATEEEVVGYVNWLKDQNPRGALL